VGDEKGGGRRGRGNVATIEERWLITGRVKDNNNPQKGLICCPFLGFRDTILFETI